MSTSLLPYPSFPTQKRKKRFHVERGVKISLEEKNTGNCAPSPSQKNTGRKDRNGRHLRWKFGEVRGGLGIFLFPPCRLSRISSGGARKRSISPMEELSRDSRKRWPFLTKSGFHYFSLQLVKVISCLASRAVNSPENAPNFFPSPLFLGGQSVRKKNRQKLVWKKGTTQGGATKNSGENVRIMMARKEKKRSGKWECEEITIVERWNHQTANFHFYTNLRAGNQDAFQHFRVRLRPGDAALGDGAGVPGGAVGALPQGWRKRRFDWRILQREIYGGSRNGRQVKLFFLPLYCMSKILYIFLNMRNTFF